MFHERIIHEGDQSERIDPTWVQNNHKHLRRRTKFHNAIQIQNTMQI